MKFFITLFSILIYLAAFGQNPELKTIDSELTNSYKTMLAASIQLRSDSLAPLFKKQLLNRLKNLLTFDNLLDSLSKYLTIKSSYNNKVKFYSWDEATGGSRHIINCFAQFKSNNGKIVIQQLNPENETEATEFGDSRAYEVYDIKIDTTTYYLTFSWGTHGGGNQYNNIRIFTIGGDHLIECTSCFLNSNHIGIEYPRSQKLNLSFDSKNNKISYNEFNQDEDTGFYKSTGKIVTLKLMAGVFINVE